MTTSSAKIPSNPNSLRDRGGARNCEYQFTDPTDDFKTPTWRALLRQKGHMQVNRQKPPRQSSNKQTPQKNRPSSTPQSIKQKLTQNY